MIIVLTLHMIFICISFPLNMVFIFLTINCYSFKRRINHILSIRNYGRGLNCAVALEAFASSYLILCLDLIISTVHYLILRYVYYIENSLDNSGIIL